MFYFIPSWYNDQRQWYDNTLMWSRIFEKMDFDDTVNQLKMFQQSQEDSALLLLPYRPQLRYFLHKGDLLSTPYWSFFDDIQHITRTFTQRVDFRTLNWPESVNFLYSPFIVLAQQHGKTIAKIYFAENGNLLSIDREEDGQITDSLIFDDRGFLSSRLVYDKGEMLYQDYLNEKGVWQVREHFKEGTAPIEINPQADKSFQKSQYASWEELALERLAVFVTTKMQPQDKVVIASDKRHNQFLASVFNEYPKIFSFFGNRFDMTDSKDLAQISKEASLIITEKEETRTAVLNSFQLLDTLTLPEVLVATPFDTRLRLGHSQSQKSLEIYLFLDSLSEEKTWRLLRRLFKLMETNPAIKLTLASYNRQLNPENFLERINHVILQEFDAAAFFTAVEDSGENQIDDSDETENTRVTVEVITSETQVISLLDRMRLVIDLGDKPDLYTQIASISAGIPQINQVATEYVSHRKNGWIVSTEEEVDKAIAYYFDGLRHWNDSLVYTVEKMGDYTSGKLLKKWKEKLEERENGESY